MHFCWRQVLPHSLGWLGTHLNYLELSAILKIADVSWDRSFIPLPANTSENKRGSCFFKSSIVRLDHYCACLWCVYSESGGWGMQTETRYAYWRQKTILKSCFSLPTFIQVPEIQLGSSGHEVHAARTLADSVLLCS